MDDEVRAALDKTKHQRTKRDVELLKTKGAIYGCCGRFAEQQACDCYERALDDPVIDPKSKQSPKPQQE